MTTTKATNEAEQWLAKVRSPNPLPNPANVPVIGPPVSFWLDQFYRDYLVLFRAIVRLEKLKPGKLDAHPEFALTSPSGDKAGCPPPPPFPSS